MDAGDRRCRPGASGPLAGNGDALADNRLFAQILERHLLERFTVFQTCRIIHDIHGGYTVHGAVIFDMGANLGQTLGQLLVRIIFILQAAHQLAAHTGEFLRIESEQLRLCHIDGDDIHMGLKP